MDRERRTGRNIKKGKKRKSAKYKRVRAFLFLVMTAVLVCMLFTGRTRTPTRSCRRTASRRY